MREDCINGIGRDIFEGSKRGPDEEGDLSPHHAGLRKKDRVGGLILKLVLRKFHLEKRDAQINIATEWILRKCINIP